MNNEQRIKILEKAVIWLITGYEIGDKVLYYDTSNKKQYVVITEMELREDFLDGFVPLVYCTLKNLEDNKTYLACAKSIGRKLTNFDLQHIEEDEEMELLCENNISINDNINHPKHYTQGNIECIDYIEDKNMNYRIGNAVKYLTRYKDKGAPIEDLEKAKWYIGREIENLKEE